MINFPSECGDFYKYRAYFLAAMGVAEFRICQYAEEIVEQIANWAYFECHHDVITQKARKALLQTERTKAISYLVQLLNTTKNKFICMQAAEFLEQIDPGNQNAIDALIQLLAETKNEYIRWQAAESLGRINPGNHNAVNTLVRLLINTQNNNICYLTANSLNETLTENNMHFVIAELQNYLESNYYVWEVIWNCAQILSYPEFYRAWNNGNETSVQIPVFQK